ncbi:hypothetical protein OXPF_33390 [Oxobacter pfennigii]|uniref:DUF7922 domain-containing protein n=1 Tax=Oxobacter pfennigii TaxID=36849 RepID=A0A0P8WL33_9CLOT|nr:hypothetical protein [Oxobacter pfennigii]KPU43089.1 hypothetical protein OXPF_33390 [Oxobacter pfennigii]
MAAKKSYNRFFIIFQEEDKGYGIGPGRMPTGYVKVETKNDKGKVTAYVQNLKPFENGECLYKCYLISHKDGKDSVAYLGIMNIDEFGRGESSWESGADNAFDTKLSIDKFNAAAIIVDREDADSVVAPLAGYMSKEKFEWRSAIPNPKAKAVQPAVQTDEDKPEDESVESIMFSKYEKEISGIIEGEAEVLSESLEVKEEEAPVENVSANEPEEKREYVNIIDQAEESAANYTRDKHKHNKKDDKKKKKNLYGHMQDMNLSPYSALMGYPNCMGQQQLPMGMSMGMPASMHMGCPFMTGNQNMMGMGLMGMDYQNFMGYPNMMGMETMDDLDNDAEEGRDMIKDALEDILEDYEEIKMDKDFPSCRLWKVDMDKYQRDGRKMFVFPCYDLIFYPFLNNANINIQNSMKKYGHYLFGIQYQDKGDRQAGRALRRLVFGIPGTNNPFEQPFPGMGDFVSWIPSSKGSKDMGYWVMMYDPITGIIGQND